ncbi:hypothetical protein PHAVU_008G033900 [Phaseolus vulgaris]|uniref:Magnesium transporter n=1 Tax=Phaseolus vulgaris TaxID=3885 RepID=V7B0Y4_PHAVU|nr:hypothetical protein PHAVU_008G033900g [Phaseolus vulgaris]ESW11484.1 hypothetical protein PHAVU_008G033900g [Phaseolus vulgaris]
MLDGEEKQTATGKGEWLLLDGKGEMELVEAGRDAIMRRTGLPARDLRRFLSYHSILLGRERVIVINLEHVKAIITVQEVLFHNSGYPSVTPFVHELQAWILRHHQDSSSSNPDAIKILPFEFVALHGCLEAVCSVLENEAKTLEQETHSALDKLTSNTLNLERIRQIMIRLVHITERVQKVRNKLEHLLEDDKDMAEMYLTEKLVNGGNTYSAVTKQLDVEDLKMFFKDYFVQMDDTLKKLSMLRNYVVLNEAHIRNELTYLQNIFFRVQVLWWAASMVLGGLLIWHPWH